MVDTMSKQSRLRANIENANIRATAGQTIEPMQ